MNDRNSDHHHVAKRMKIDENGVATWTIPEPPLRAAFDDLPFDIFDREYFTFGRYSSISIRWWCQSYLP
jgi:hypothetical protein